MVDLSAVVVTYGDRVGLITKCIDSLSKFREVFIVLNGYSERAKSDLLKFIGGDDRVRIIDMGRNTGSAGGFYAGLKSALEEGQAKYILLIDDDNLLNHLSEDIEVALEEGGSNSIFFLARPSRKEYEKIRLGGAVSSQFPHPRSCLGFDLLTKLFGVHHHYDAVPWLPYSGVVFTRDGGVEMPNPDYFLYADDHDCMYRNLQNRELKLLSPSLGYLVDMDESWNRISFLDSFIVGHPFRVFYYVRNRVNFELRVLNSFSFRWFLNSIVLSIVLYIHALRKRRVGQISLLVKAFWRGVRGELGEDESVVCK